LSDDAPAANSIVDTFAGSDWEFEVAADIRAVGARLKAFRLLVYSGGEVGFLEAAQTFAGPWLSLEGVGSVNSVTEIRGAMEAME